MATVTPQLIRELRDRTQAGMTDCKNALVEADGNVDKAVEIILKKGLAKAAKRASAVATEGEIRAAILDDGRAGVMVEVNIQTDFAAKNEKFKAFVDEVNKLAAKVNSLDELLQSTLATGKTVKATQEELTGAIGEKIDVRRFARVELTAAAGRVHSYVHMNGKIGVLLVTEAENAAVASHPAFAKFIDDTAMQIAAMSPLYLDRSQVAASDLDKQREIFVEQIKSDPKPKPEAAWPKIVEGKVAKWYTEVCLVDQPSVIVSDKSVEEMRAQAAKEAGGSIKLVRFIRFALGEGLQKKEDDFAAEARRMAGTT